MKLPVGLLLLAWAAGIAIVVSGGTVMDDYARLKSGLESLPYPTSGVALACLLATVEVVLLAGLLRPLTYRRSTGRAALATALAALLCLGHAMLLTHAPAYRAWHAWWLFGVCIGLLVTTAVSAMAAAGRAPAGSGLRCPACAYEMHRGWLITSRRGRITCPHCRDPFRLRMRHKMGWLATLVAAQVGVLAGLVVLSPGADGAQAIVALEALVSAAIGWMALDAFEPVAAKRAA